MIVYTEPREITAGCVRVGDELAVRRARPMDRPMTLWPSPENSGWGLQPDDVWATITCTMFGDRRGARVVYVTPADQRCEAWIHPHQIVIIRERIEVDPWNVTALMTAEADA